ncbi:MAG: hypothetical protein D6677_02165 [Calditrichaeota bacterium]|nr:MAG: hypothetical protein D6677_02165 [Calditrichota bacterium]
MKRYINYTLLGITVLVLLFACKGNKQENDATPHKAEFVAEEGGFQFLPAATTVRWTAYKTSDKLPVKGTFKLDSTAFTGRSGASPLAAVDGAQFNIPASAIFSGNPERDAILRDFFFGLMDKTVSLTGTFSIDKSDHTSGILAVTMNSESHDVPVRVTLAGDTVRINGVLDLNNWHVSKALASLNEHCKLQHTGPDGKSKTWSEVAIEAETVVRAH